MIAALALLLSTSFATAAPCDGVVGDFTMKSQQIIRETRAKNGYVNPAWSTIADAPTGVSIEATPWLERAESPSTSEMHLSRESAQWSCPHSGCKIEVNCTLWPKSSPDARQVIGLHERAGTHHLDDGHYQSSLRYWLLSLPAADQILNPDEKQSIEQDLTNSGGITGVGGGGDTSGVIPQIILLKKDLAKLNGATTNRAQLFARLKEDFSIRTEVRRARDGRLLETYSNQPIDRGPEVRIVTACLQVLEKPRSDQQMIYAGMIQNNASMLQKLPTFESFVKMCKDATEQ